MEQTLCRITSNTVVAPGLCLMWIEAPGIASSAQPGQFITVRCGDLTLRRPFSVHQVRSNNVIDNNDVIASLDAVGARQSQIALLFQVAGKGTLWLSQRQTGEMIDVLGPLGNGFRLPPPAGDQEAPSRSSHLLLVAGGIGIAPLILLAQRASSQHRITLIHGAVTAAQIYPFGQAGGGRASPEGSAAGLQMQGKRLPSLPEEVRFIAVTEDGSRGRRGMVTDVLPDFLDRADHVYACGPVEMYHAMAHLIRHSAGAPTESGRPNNPAHDKVREEFRPRECQVSLEVRMGCGFGACYGCTINTRKGLRQVCRDGPVFELDDIIWQEVRI